MKTGQMGAIPPSAILSQKGVARYGGVSRTGPLRLLPDYDVVVDNYVTSSTGGDAPVEIVKIISDDTPAYHAIKGPVGSNAKPCIPLVAQARMLHVHGGELDVFSFNGDLPRQTKPIMRIDLPEVGVTWSWLLCKAPRTHKSSYQL